MQKLGGGLHVVNLDAMAAGAGAPVSTIESVVLEPSELVAGTPQSVKGTVKLTSPALPGGVDVGLFSDQPGVTMLPPVVRVSPGESSATFAMTVSPVNSEVVANVKAMQGDVVRGALLTVHPQPTTNGISPAPPATAPIATLAPAAAAVGPRTLGQMSESVYDGLLTAAQSVLDPSHQPKCEQSFRAALLAVVPIVPFVALVAMLAIYAAPQSSGLSLFDPLLAGSAFALAVGLAVAFVRWRIIEDTSAERANGSAFHELRERFGEITARLVVATENASAADPGQQLALRQVQASWAQIAAELRQSGPGWIMGTGYMSVWKLIHRVEEALIELEPGSEILAAALYDEQRLAGSNIDSSDKLVTRLRIAVAAIDRTGLAYLNQAPLAPPSGGASSTEADPLAERNARCVLREIRRTINEFRDESWDAMVRTRNHLLATLTMTGVVTYLGLMMALDLSPTKTTAHDARTDAIIGAAVFFLVGAMVGLFNRLSAESKDANDVADYGLTEARLSLTPVLAGLAAIGGVLLTAMLTNTLGGVLAPATGQAAISQVIPTVADVYNLTANPFGLVLAAVFGLSPAMLISTLQAQADKYKGDLQSTAPHS